MLETIQNELADNLTLLDFLRNFFSDPQGEEFTAFDILLTTDSDFTLINADTGVALPTVFILNEDSKDTKIAVQHNGASNSGLDHYHPCL